MHYCRDTMSSADCWGGEWQWLGRWAILCHLLVRRRCVHQLRKIVHCEVGQAKLQNHYFLFCNVWSRRVLCSIYCCREAQRCLPGSSPLSAGLWYPNALALSPSVGAAALLMLLGPGNLMAAWLPGWSKQLAETKDRHIVIWKAKPAGQNFLLSRQCHAPMPSSPPPAWWCHYVRHVRAS